MSKTSGDSVASCRPELLDWLLGHGGSAPQRQKSSSAQSATQMVIHAASNDPPNAVQRPTVYSAPRRYDLATMFVVSVAYAILFAGMRLLGAGPLAFVITGLFFTVIAAAQALWFKGKAPRMASCVAGTAYFVALNVAFYVSVYPSGPVRMISSRIFAAGAGMICFAVAGAMCGYGAGALVGGVFLIADQLRRGRRQR